MKYVLFILLLLGKCILTGAQNTDLPGPNANLQTLPSGSYVIAMDNTQQVNSSGDFNLKAYGLIVYLLNNTVRVRWSIKAGKAKDGIDFSANAEMIKPTYAAGAARDFKAGPFVIFASDTTGVAALIDAFYTTNSLNGLNRPQVYRTTADVANVDIRYDLWGFRPKAAVLTDGGNQNIHIAYMTAAAIPSSNYATSPGTDLLSNCFTFASEPHNTNTGTAVNSAISAIKDFVTKGGNFLAQCEAINNYENNTLGRFQTTGGLTIANTNIGTTLTYSNPDLSFSQFEGAYNASSGGSLKNWKIVGTTANSEHDHATGTGTNSAVIGASVSKHYWAKGGLVFYVGNHSFTTSTLAGINGIRMYMNAFLTPSNTNCPSLAFVALPLKLTAFNGWIQGEKIFLNWRVDENGLASAFTVQKSLDGIHFTNDTSITAVGMTGSASYGIAVPLRPIVYYRLVLVDKQAHIQYSSVLRFSKDQISVKPSLMAQENPFMGDLHLGYWSNSDSKAAVHVYSTNGQIVYSGEIIGTKGYTLWTIPAFYFKASGLYHIELTDERGLRLTIKAVRM